MRDQGGMMRPTRHGWKVGDLWVQIDYEARAVSVVRGDGRIVRSALTENLGDGVLIDRNAEGEIIAVEVLGAAKPVVGEAG